MNIDPNGVVPPLCGADLKDVMAAAQRLNFDALTDADIGELCKSASEHNPETGFQMDSVVALACGLELKGRNLVGREFQLKDAIDALKLAKECGGENDRDQMTGW